MRRFISSPWMRTIGRVALAVLVVADLVALLAQRSHGLAAFSAPSTARVAGARLSA